MRTKQKEAKAKGEAEPGANSLKDLNRCTFVFDSPAVRSRWPLYRVVYALYMICI